MLEQEPARALPRQAPLALIPSTAKTLLRLLAVVVLLGGCATAAEITGTAMQQDVVQLRADLTAVQASVRQMKTQLETLGPQVDGRLRDQVAEQERRAAELTRRLEGLTTTVTGLMSRLDELNGRVEALNRQLRAAVPRPATPPGPPTTAPAPSTPPPAGTPAPSPGAKSATGAVQPQDIYQAAYIDFSKGSYALAVTGFREFLRRYPEHPLAANAQYWIGEAYLSLARSAADTGQGDRANEELQRSVQEFRKVLASYPRSDKAPAALYKEALVLIELKQPALAQQRLQYLVDNFPQAEETPLARERLASLKER